MAQRKISSIPSNKDRIFTINIPSEVAAQPELRLAESVFRAGVSLPLRDRTASALQRASFGDWISIHELSRDGEEKTVTKNSTEGHVVSRKDGGSGRPKKERGDCFGGQRQGRKEGIGEVGCMLREREREREDTTKQIGGRADRSTTKRGTKQRSCGGGSQVQELSGGFPSEKRKPDSKGKETALFTVIAASAYSMPWRCNDLK